MNLFAYLQKKLYTTTFCAHSSIFGATFTNRIVS